jgi:hypothetical protein
MNDKTTATLRADQPLIDFDRKLWGMIANLADHNFDAGFYHKTDTLKRMKERSKDGEDAYKEIAEYLKENYVRRVDAPTTNNQEQ